MRKVGILILFSTLPALAGAGIDASLRATSIFQASQELCHRIAGDSGDPISARKTCELAAQGFLAGKSSPCTAASLRNLQLELAHHLCLKSPTFGDRAGEKTAAKVNCYRTVAGYFGLRDDPDSCERFGSGTGLCYRKKLDAERERARDREMGSGIVAKLKSLFGQADAAEGCPSFPSTAMMESAQTKSVPQSSTSSNASSTTVETPNPTGRVLR